MTSSVITSNKNGYLYKWTNYMKGYKKRWFVLQDGFLSYYRHEKEICQRCRGTINIASATVHVTDNLHFVIANRGAQTYHLRSASESEQKQWLAALELAKSKALLLQQKASDFDVSSQEPSGQAERYLNELTKRLQELRKCQETAEKKCDDLSRVVSELDCLRAPTSSSSSTGSTVGSSTSTSSTPVATNGHGVTTAPTGIGASMEIQNARLIYLCERANIMRLAVKSLIKASNDYQMMAAFTVKKLQNLFEEDRSYMQRLEQMIEDLAKQHSNLEEKVLRSRAAAGCSPGVPHHQTRESGTTATGACSSDESFYDAPEELGNDNVVSDSRRRLQIGSAVEPVGSGVELLGYGNEYESDVETDEEMEAISPRHSQISTTPAEETSTASPLKGHKGKKKRHRGQRASSGSVMSNVHEQMNKSSINGPSTSARGAMEVSMVIRAPYPRRTAIPPMPNISIDLWSIMKNCIGKDLSRIPMPVNFSEPLSMLQRLCEDYEHSICLDRAAQCQDSIETLAYVAAFTVSSYASTARRVHKPFNPLLGETFECDRTDDLGWRYLAEQMSHHPPRAALHCQSQTWTSWQDFSMVTQFRGKYLQLRPLGSAHLLLHATGHHFSWRKVISTVHNIVVGQLWLDHAGEMQIVNHSTGEVCSLCFHPYSYFSRERPRRVTGTIRDASGNVVYALQGAWDDFLEGTRMAPTQASQEPGESSNSKSRNPVLEKCGPPVRLWEMTTPLSVGSEQMYNFGPFAVSLNEPEAGVAPTDSRFRPDQRLMELGKWDEANQEKLRLEQQQRNRAKKMSTVSLSSPLDMAADSSTQSASSSTEDSLLKNKVPLGTTSDDSGYSPLWFQRVVDEDTGQPTVRFTGEYWLCKSRGDWSRCPAIF